jgi:predicted amidophosphoribosyltransferase
MDVNQVHRDEPQRLKRERRTIQVMMRIYCRDKHQTPHGLCPECLTLLAYANERLDHCVYQAEKPTCLNCPIHCYRKQQREDMRTMMRYAGPHMLLWHPFLAIMHLLDGKRAAPQLRSKRTT